MPLVRNVIRHPETDAPVVGATWKVRLVANDADPDIGGFHPGDEYEIRGQTKAVSDEDGLIEIDLVPNSELEPANTYYLISENVKGSRATYAVIVPAGAGPFWLFTILADAPEAPDPLFLASTLEAIAAEAQFRETHEARVDNPHAVTAAQAGAETPAGAQVKATAAENAAKAYADDGHLVDSDRIGVDVAELVGGLLPSARLPQLAIVNVETVNSQAAMLALNVQKGDVAIRPDVPGAFILAGNDPAVLANWVQLPIPIDAVVSVNGQIGVVNLAAADVGAAAAVHLHDDRYYTEAEADAQHDALEVARDAADGALQDSIDDEAAARAAADALLIPLAQKGSANGVATLGADSKIPTAQLPALAIGETFPVANQAAMLALNAQRGDAALRTDFDPDKWFILTTDDPTQLANWIEITAQGAVQTVNGQVGAVVLDAGDVGADALGSADAAEADAIAAANAYADAQVATRAKRQELFNPQHVMALGAKLKMGYEPACVLCQGDSTSVASTTGLYQAIQYVAAAFPAYSLMHRLWNHANQSFDPYTVLQTGSAGEGYISLPGAINNYLSTPDSVPLSIVGDLDVRIKVALTDWTPSGKMCLVAKWGSSAGSRSFRWEIDTAGKMEFDWTADGTTSIGPVVSTNALGITDGTVKWLRATLAVSNRVVTFYTSDDGITWTQVHASTAGASTAIADTTTQVSIGARNDAGASDFLGGKVYYAEVRNGIAGKVVASPLASTIVRGNSTTYPNPTTFNDGEGNTWSINGPAGISSGGSPAILFLNASVSGAAIAYATDATRFTLMTPIEPQLAFINYSHNEAGTVAYQSTYEGLVTQLQTKYPNVGVVALSQNPKKAPETAANIRAHAVRNAQIALAAARNRWAFVHVYRAFLDTGTPDLYVGADGIHPSQAGYDLGRDQIKELLDAGVQAA